MHDPLESTMVLTASIHPRPTALRRIAGSFPVVSMRYRQWELEKVLKNQGTLPFTWWPDSAPSLQLLNSHHSWEEYRHLYISEMIVKLDALRRKAQSFTKDQPVTLLCCEHGPEVTAKCHRRLLRALLIGQPPDPDYCPLCLFQRGQEDTTFNQYVCIRCRHRWPMPERSLQVTQRSLF